MKKDLHSSFASRRIFGCLKKSLASKGCILLFIVLLSGKWLVAQITVTNATFPVASDILKTAIASNPAIGIAAHSAPGGNQVWDLSGLLPGTLKNTLFQPASLGIVGAQLPGAELFTSPAPFQEEYYNVTPTKFELQAYYGIQPYLVNSPQTFHYVPLAERYAPMNMFDVNAYTSGILATFPSSEMNPLLLSIAYPYSSQIDSFRHRVAISQTNVVDAWGTMIIPGGTYNVLRRKSTRIRQGSIDARFLILSSPWYPVTDFVIAAGFPEGLGADTTITYTFFNNVEKEPIATVTFNGQENTILQVIYKYNIVCTPPTVNAPTDTQPTCATPTGTIVVNATGSGTLEYALNNGAYQTSSTFSGLAPGNYDIHVRSQDAPSCIADYASNPVVINAVPLCSTLSINDVTHNEDNSGPTTYSFTVSLSSPAPAGGVTFDIATANNTATAANNDYVQKSLTSQTILQGSSIYTFDVTVNGDAFIEPNESFFVNVTNVIGATVSDGQGLGTITNDDCAPGSQTFNYTGAVQDFVVPTGVVFLSVAATGADGGDALFGAAPFGGSGGLINATFPVLPGDNIRVIVGQAGKSYGSGIPIPGGSGAGGTAVINCGNPSNCATGTLLVVAGAGGGGRISDGGGASSIAGTGAGGSSSGSNGGGGGVNGPGGGFSMGGGQASKTSISLGGSTGDPIEEGGKGFGGGGSHYEFVGQGGGGGGGGYTGGNGTLNAGSGGSNFVDATAVSGFTNNGGTTGGSGGDNTNGVVTLSYSCPVPGPTSSVLSVNGTSIICSGTQANLKVTITGGVSPYTVVYSDGSNNFTVNSYISGADIPVSPAATKTYSLISVTDANSNAGTGNSGTPTITVQLQNPVVTNNNNTGTGSLRQAILDACPGSIITFDPTVFSVSQTITLASTLPSINKELTITGPGANLLSVSGNNAALVFIINNENNSTYTVSLSGLSIINGNGAFAGGIGQIHTLQATTLLISSCMFSNNTSSSGAGAIFSTGFLTVNNCTFNNNSVGVSPGSSSAGIFAANTLTLSNSTFTNNSGRFGGAVQISNGTITNCTFNGNSATQGGAIYIGGNVTITNCTISGNSCTDTGGGIVNGASLGSTINVGNTIVAGNTALQGADLRSFQNIIPAAPTFTSQGYNLIGNNDLAAWTSATGDQVGTPAAPINPLLGAMADNGGPTFTMALLPGSPAIDKGSFVAGVTTDQRGLTRPVDNSSIPNATNGNGSDIGAFEVQCSAPVFSVCPSNQFVNALTNSCSNIVNYTATATGTPDPTVTYAFTGATTGTGNGTGSGSSFNVGVTTVVLTATNNCGEPASCTFTVTVVDAQNPSITCPANITQNNDPNLCGAVVTYAATASDNCPGVSVGYSPASGSFFPVGTTTVTATATDAAGRTASCTFTVTVVDAQNPTITCPANITKNNDPGQCGALVTYAATASDNCPGTPTISYSPLSGSFFPAGTTTVTATAADANGNTASCTFTVTVVDAQNPTIGACPANITVNNTTNQCGANVTYNLPSASDNCPGVIVSSSHPSGSSFPVGTTTVTVTATDASGRTASCTFTVTVVDAQNPTITCPANMVVSNTPGQCGAFVNFSATASDNCPGTTISYSPASGSFFFLGTTTVTATATDAAGRTATCTFTVKVSDTQAPTLTCPANVTQYITSGCSKKLTPPQPTVIDNCGLSKLTWCLTGATTGDSPTSGINYVTNKTFNAGVTTITYTATDIYGNTSECSFTVSVLETVLPNITCPSNKTVGTDYGYCFWSHVNLGTPSVSDNCGIASVTNNAPDTFQLGTTIVTWTVTDNSGNTRSCNQTITVLDKQTPSVTCPANIYQDASATCVTTVTAPDPTYYDNCTVAKLTWQMTGATTGSSPTTGINVVGTKSYNVGTTTITYTIKDAANNSWSCSFAVTITDRTRPTITCPANIVMPATAGACNRSIAVPDPVYSDNCNVTKLTWYTSGATNIGSPTSGINKIGTKTFNVGVTTVTYTAYDPWGNSKQCTFTITVTDNQPPVVSCPADRTLCKVSNNTYSIPAMTRSDNCSVASTTYQITGVTTRSGTGTNASGTFNLGLSTITWTVTDAAGNTSTCSTNVNIVPAGSCRLVSNEPTDDPKAAESKAPSKGKLDLIVQDAKLGVTAYPNPTDYYFNVKVTSQSKETVEIRMYDGLGKVVQVKRGAVDQTYRFGDNVVGGIYIIEVRQAGQVATVKVMKL